MLKYSLATALIASLAVVAPHKADADLKDALLGAAVGAMVNQTINNNSRGSTQRVTPQRTTRKSSSSRPATLNGSYTRSERIEIQTALNAQGFPVGVVDGSLGRKSRDAISRFQATRGEPITGQLTRSQFIALTTPGATMSTAPASGRSLDRQEVAMLQHSLSMLGLYRSSVDGLDGPGTRAATAEFLAMQGRNAVNTTAVQTLVLAATAARQQVPPALMQEAQSTMANAAPQNGFGAAPATPFGQQPTTPVFGAPAASGFGQTAGQTQPVFGQPAGMPSAQPFDQQPQQPAGQMAQQPFGQPAPAASQPQPLFSTTATTAPQGGAPQAGTPATTAPQQPLFGAAPSESQAAPAQGGQLNGVMAGQPAMPSADGQSVPIFAAGGGQATATPAQQASGSALDIFAAPPTEPSATASAQPVQTAPATGNATSAGAPILATSGAGTTEDATATTLAPALPTMLLLSPTGN